MSDGSSRGKGGAYYDEKAFAEQWNAVTKEYPLVAIRYLELLRAVMNEWYRRNDFFVGALSRAKVCEEGSPIRATKAFCDKVFTRQEDGEDFPPPPCPPPRNDEDIPRYLDCLLP